MVKEIGKVLTDISSDEGSEEDCVKKMKTYNVPLALPCAWFGSAVGLIVIIVALLFGFGILADTVRKCASPAMVVLVGQVSSVVAIPSRWSDRSL